MSARRRAEPTTNTRGIQPCANCHSEVFYSVSAARSRGSEWLHSDTFRVWCEKEAKP